MKMNKMIIISIRLQFNNFEIETSQITIVKLIFHSQVPLPSEVHETQIFPTISY